MPTGGMIQRAIAAGEPSAATLDTPADVVAPKQPDSRVEAAAPVRMPPAARSGARREPRATVQRATPRATRTSSSRIEGDNTQPERNVMVGNRIGPTWARFDEPR